MTGFPSDPKHRPDPLDPTLYTPVERAGAEGRLPLDHPPWRDPHRASKSQTQPETPGRDESPAAKAPEPKKRQRGKRGDPQAPASCRGCPRKWTGLAEAHCAACHHHFGSLSGFDRHRLGGECRDPATLLDRFGRRVFTERKGPHGSTWVLADDRPHYRTDEQPAAASLPIRHAGRRCGQMQALTDQLRRDAA